MQLFRQLAEDRAQPRAPLDCAVVVPLYNKGPFIARALRSIGQQSLPPCRIIVIDDGSTDDGPAQVAAYAQRDPRIVLIRQLNAGVSVARNRGITAATSEWVSFLDADDAYLPWFLEEMAALARCSQSAVALGAAFLRMPPDFDLESVQVCPSVEPTIRKIMTRLYDRWWFRELMPRFKPEVDEIGHDSQPARRGVVVRFYDRWWRGNFIHTSSICVRRDVLTSFNTPFPPNEQRGEDVDLIFRLAERGPVAWTSRVSAFYAVGVTDSLTSDGSELTPVPAIERLRARVQQPDFPAGERAGARRTLATYWLTVARRRIKAGDLIGAWALMREPIAAWRPDYWLRTMGLVLAAVLSTLFSRPRAGPALHSSKKGQP